MTVTVFKKKKDCKHLVYITPMDICKMFIQRNVEATDCIMLLCFLFVVLRSR